MKAGHYYSNTRVASILSKLFLISWLTECASLEKSWKDFIVDNLSKTLGPWLFYHIKFNFVLEILENLSLRPFCKKQNIFCHEW